MTSQSAQFHVGQLIHHRLFDYRGVIVDVDPVFEGSEEWYDQVARTRPPKDSPWYRVLVHRSDAQTYVAERNLEPDSSDDPIEHPLVDEVFGGFDNGRYRPRERAN